LLAAAVAVMVAVDQVAVVQVDCCLQVLIFL
jgi:hypothetical protein